MFIFLAILFSLISLFMAFKCHDRFDPARWFILMWAGQIVLFYVIFHNMFTFTGYGLAYISMICLTFSIGTLIGQFLGNHMPEVKQEYSFNNKRAFFFFLTSLTLGLLNIILSIHEYDFSVKEIFSFRNLVEMNVLATDLRYSTNMQSSMFHQITLIFVYLSPLYGGYLLPLFTDKKKIFCYISILPALMISITEAMKFPFIAGVVLWIVGIIVSSFANNKSFFRVKKSAILKLGISGGLFFAILILSIFFRNGRFEAEIFEQIKLDFLNYACGHLPAFDAWFTNNIGKIDPEGGIKTFYGISNFLGLAVRKQGVFEEWIYYGQSINHQIPSVLLGTNVYTMFRFLLEDFGFIGSFILMFLTGIVSGFSWLMVKMRNFTLFFQIILIAVLFSIPMSFIASIWAWTSTIATVVLFYFVLLYTFSKKTVEITACQKI